MLRSYAVNLAIKTALVTVESTGENLGGCEWAAYNSAIYQNAVVLDRLMAADGASDALRVCGKIC